MNRRGWKLCTISLSGGTSTTTLPISSFLTATAAGSSSLMIQLISSSTSPSSTPSPDRVEFSDDPVDELL